MQTFLYLQHAVAGVDKRFIDAEFSIRHKLLSVKTVATDKSTRTRRAIRYKTNRRQEIVKKFTPSSFQRHFCIQNNTVNSTMTINKLIATTLVSLVITPRMTKRRSLKAATNTGELVGN